MTAVLIIVVALLAIAATAFFVVRSESRKGPACCREKKGARLSKAADAARPGGHGRVTRARAPRAEP